MTAEDVVELLAEIETLYPNRFRDVDEERRFDAFYKVMKEQEFSEVMRNLYRHAQRSPHPPGVAELVKLQERSKVASAEETLEYYKRFERKEEPQEEIEKARAEARKEMERILGRI